MGEIATKRGNSVVYRESKTFDRRAAAPAWIAKLRVSDVLECSGYGFRVRSRPAGTPIRLSKAVSARLTYRSL
jgi:hypothetical protein